MFSVRYIGDHAVDHGVGAADKRLARKPNARIIEYPHAEVFVRRDYVDGVHRFRSAPKHHNVTIATATELTPMPAAMSTTPKSAKADGKPSANSDQGSDAARIMNPKDSRSFTG